MSYLLYLMYLSIFGLIVCIYNMYQNKMVEKFDHGGYSGKIAMRPYINVGKHARISKQNTVESISMKKPLPKSGETRCVKTECPNYLSGDVYCWRCE